MSGFGGWGGKSDDISEIAQIFLHSELYGNTLEQLHTQGILHGPSWRRKEFEPDSCF